MQEEVDYTKHTVSITKLYSGSSHGPHKELANYLANGYYISYEGKTGYTLTKSPSINLGI